MSVNRIRLPRGVAAVLGVSLRKANELAKTDPQFPPVLALGPRTRLVDEPALLHYVECKRVPSASGNRA